MIARIYALIFLALNLVAVGYAWLFTEAGEFHDRLGKAAFWLVAFIVTLSVYNFGMRGKGE